MRPSLLSVLLLATAAVGADGPAKLDLNEASPKELETIAGVGPATAARIVRVRERNGPYRCIEELQAVPRLTAVQVKAIRERAFVQDPDPRCLEQSKMRSEGRPLKPRAL